MKKIIFGLLFLFSSNGFCVEKLSDCYLVSYGNAEAIAKVTSYYSFSCPHCVALFREEFEDLKNNYLDSDKILFTFHPVPADLLTVQAMVCLEQLSSLKKQIFLEALLAEVDLDDQDYSAILMVKAMEILGHPVPSLRDREFLSQTKAFNSAFEFLKQEDKIIDVPTVEVNGDLYKKEIPSIKFIETFLNQSAKQENI
jgi:Thioredoxin